MQPILVGISFATAHGEAAYLPLAHHYAGAPAQLAGLPFWQLKPLLETPNPNHRLLSNYDRHIFANYGIALGGVIDDTLLHSYVLEAHHRTNSAIWQRATSDWRRSATTMSPAWRVAHGFDWLAIERASEYAAEDADITLRVRDALAPQIAAFDKLAFVYRNIELPVAQILFRMERAGVLLDRNLLAVQSGELGRKMLELEQRAYQEAGQPFNLGSPKQIGDICFTQKGLPVVKKTPGGAPSTDEVDAGAAGARPPHRAGDSRLPRPGKLKSTTPTSCRR